MQLHAKSAHLPAHTVRLQHDYTNRGLSAIPKPSCPAPRNSKRCNRPMSAYRQPKTVFLSRVARPIAKSNDLVQIQRGHDPDDRLCASE